VRLAWGQRHEQRPDGDAPPHPDATPFELSAVDLYTLDGRHVAWIATNGDRASDMLNREGEIPLHGMTAVSPADETVSFADVPAGGDGSQPLERSQVRFIVPPPLPANRHLRLHRRRVLVSLRMGPYEVSGQAHVRPGADAADYLLRSGRAFVPLTEVEVVHLEGPEFRRYMPVLIINVSHVTEMINMERRERAIAAAPPPAVTPEPVASSAPRGPVLSRLQAAATPAPPPDPAIPAPAVATGRHSELLGALQLLLDHGLMDAVEFQQKRAALQHRA
jgi:hypothetical protein